MPKKSFRKEKDSLGSVQVPSSALYGAQTQRAVNNFPVSGIPFSRRFLEALGIIKGAAAAANRQLGRLSARMSSAIKSAAREVEIGKRDDQFPLDIFQTGSGTSTNMNANEVIARLASRRSGIKIHPNDHVNMSQSSNDVIPAAIHVAAALSVTQDLLPALAHLEKTIQRKAAQVNTVVKTGRTHLMDAMPIRMGQELSGWGSQVAHGRARIKSCLPRLKELALGGTAVGTGINAPRSFGRKVAAQISKRTGVRFRASQNYFESLSSQDTAVELSGQLKVLAVSLMKISNDLRWMNSGPNNGLGEITLPALQPGSSIMPGKVNPVIPESVAQVCAQVIGNDAVVTVGGASGNFQLNVMLPVIAHNLLESIQILASASRLLSDKAIKGFTVNKVALKDSVERNPILVTALNSLIGYEAGAAIAKQAFRENRKVLDLAQEKTQFSSSKLKKVLNPRRLTDGGIPGHNT